MAGKIEKMARIMCQRKKPCILCEVQSPCICRTYAELLYAEGYEKAEDVVPRSEIEALTDERDRYKRYYFNHAYDELEAEAKQEAYKEVFEEIDKIVWVSPEQYAELRKKYIGE